MSVSKVDFYIVVDNSSPAKYHPNILQAFSQLMREILEYVSDDIESLHISTFDNVPTRNFVVISPIAFEENLISNGKGGMCNVHLALKNVANTLIHSPSRRKIILLFLVTDPTDDNGSILSEKERAVLHSLPKYLIKSSLQIICPDGFKGCNEYLLQDEEEAQRLIEDLKGIITKDSESQNEETHSEDTENTDSSVLSFYDQRNDELQPPEYYQYD